MRKGLLYAAFVICLMSGFVDCHSQMPATQETGILPYGAYQGGDIDSIDLKSGNLFAKIPLFSLPQLGALSLSMSMVLNDSGWGIGDYCDPTGPTDSDPSEPVGEICFPWVYRSTNFGPALTFDQNMNVIFNQVDFQEGGGIESIGYYYYTASLVDATGSVRGLDNEISSSNIFGSNDGSGYIYYATNVLGGQDQGNLYSPSGLAYAINANGFVGGLVQSITDLNNNQITISPPAPPAVSPPWPVNFPFQPMVPVGASGSEFGNDGLPDGTPTNPPFRQNITDSLGRVIPGLGSSSYLTDSSSLARCPSLNVSNQQPAAIQEWQVPGPNGVNTTYWFCYTNITVNTNFEGGWQNNDMTYDMPYYADYIGTGNVVQSIILPNGTYWGFVYDSAGPPVIITGGINTDATPIAYGDVTKIIYPTGGSVSYNYLSTAGAQAAFPCLPAISTMGIPANTYAGRAVQTRTLNDDLTGPQTWSYTYAAIPNGQYSPVGLTTTVTDPAPSAGNTQSSTVHTFLDASIGACALPEVQTQVMDGSTVIQNTTTQYYSVTQLYPGSDSDWEASQKNMLPHVVTTQQGSGTVTTTYSYPSLFTDELWVTGPEGNNPNATSLFAPAATILFDQPSSVTTTGSDGSTRTTATTYEWQNQPAFQNANVLTAVGMSCTSSGSQTCALVGSGIGSGSQYLYGDTNSPFNLVTVQQMLDENWVTTKSLSYDSFGRIIGIKDALGNPTTISYGVDPVTGAASPFPNKITNALSQKDYFLFDDNTGNVLWHTDVNGTAADDSHHTTTYGYDLLGRPTSIQDAAGGLTMYCYTDTGGTLISGKCSASSPPFSAYATTQASPDPVMASQTNYDGLGRTVSSIAANGAETDTAYDSLGRVYTVTNPYFTTAGASTTINYDALGRKTVQTQPDGKTLTWCYNSVATLTTGQNCLSGKQTTLSAVSWVDATDENGHVTQQVSDGLGNLRAVMEQSPANTGSTLSFLETDYSYDILGNLTGVSQLGNNAGDTARVRAFQYDSLSRLTAACNPEMLPPNTSCDGSHWITYGYDHNSNLTYKLDLRNIQTTYTYDTLNRLTGKTYSGDSALTPSTCYQYGTSASVGANLIGELQQEWTQSASLGLCPSTPPATGVITRISATAYDAVGRLINSQQCVLTSCGSGGVFSIAQTYNAAGGLHTWTDGVHPTTFTAAYNGAGQLQTLSSSWVDPIHPATLFSVPTSATSNTTNCGPSSASGYTAAGALQNWSLGPNLNVVRGYDTRLRVTCETATVP